MRHLELSRGEVALVDDGDFGLVGSMKWSYMPGRRTGYAYRKASGTRRSVLLHRVLMGLQDVRTGENLAPPGRRIEVDHVSGDGLDNRRSNLRVVTRTGHALKDGAYGAGKSGRRGVHWSEEMQRWMARIKVDGKARYLGSFDDPDEASRCYEEARRVLVSSLA